LLQTRRLKERHILVKALQDARLGPGFLRVTTALPEENSRFLRTVQSLLPAVGQITSLIG
jgi:histidinol-phosphate aminotransferase